MSRRLRIAIVGGARFGFSEPYAGGMEAHTADLTYGLRDRGHHVTVFAGRATADNLGSTPIWANWEPSGDARSDMSVDPQEVIGEHLAYQQTMLGLGRSARRGEFDHVHLNNCHHLPIAMAPSLGVPVTSTLHSPPTDWLAAAFEQASLAGSAPWAVAVSDSLARDYEAHTGWRPGVVENGVDLSTFVEGPGDGGYLAWTGRLVAEKAPQLAIDAARAVGIPIRLAGPSHDRGFFDAEIAPRLGPGVSYVGHLDRASLAGFIGAASAALVTPAWPEPFGLAAVEALACGTPVAAVALGALPDLIDTTVGALCEPTVAALAEATLLALGRDRREVRRKAQQRFSLARMLDEYEALFAAVHTDTTGIPVDRLEPVA